jgi:hemolysin activation/secretion protein
MRTSTCPEAVSKTLRRGLFLLTIIGLCSGPCWAEDVARIFITEIITDTSQILSESEIESVTSRYVRRDVTITDLNEMVGEINELYRQRGFITAKAILPAQKIENGVVRVRLVEGRIGRVVVEGNRSAAASYFTKRIRLTPGDLIRLDRMTNEVGYFNRVNDDQVNVQLTPGEEFGTTDCVLVIQEARDQRIVFIDNAGRDETGLIRLGATFVRSHLFGHGDPLSVSGVWAQGTLAGSVSYRVPIGVRGARLTIGYDGSQIDILSPGFEDLDIKGYSSDVHMEFGYPLVVTPKLRVWGPVQLHHRSSNSTFSGASLVGSVVRTAGVGLNVQWEGSGLVGYGQCDYQVGETKLENGDGEGDTFSKGDCSFTGQTALANRLFLTVRGAVQETKDQLPSSEKFSVGGASTVRGYPEGALIGDRGFFASVELEAPMGSRLAGIVFVDHGGAFAATGSGVAHESGHLTGMGVGVSARILPGLSCKVAYGMSQQRSPRVHVSLQASL